jgi:hypothetical protein
MSLAGRKQISESGAAEGAESAEARVKESPGLGESGCPEEETRGEIAALTAAEVLILRASRRVIFSVIGWANYIAQDLVSRQYFFGERKRRF